MGHDHRMSDRVMVLAGGLSHEREVSLRSGRRLLDALRTAGVEAELRDADTTLLPLLTADPPDAVVIALHGAAGEDGSLRGVLDLCGVPYVGATPVLPGWPGTSRRPRQCCASTASPPRTGSRCRTIGSRSSARRRCWTASSASSGCR